MTFALKPEPHYIWDGTQEQLYMEIIKTYPDAKNTREGVIIDLKEAEVWEFRNKLVETLGFYINVYKPNPTQTFNVGTI